MEQFRVYYSIKGELHRSKLVHKVVALALYKIHTDAFLVSKEDGLWQRVLRFSPLGVPLSTYPR